ncbi:MAG: class I tRNA ligase family protein, partial [Clostridiales bacterium]
TKIKEISCSICGTKPNFKETKHLFFRLSDFKNFLIDYIENHDEWRINAINNSKKYIEEGLYDRAITRDLDWGIDSSIEGFRDKKIYVWFEAVLGYISATKEYCRRNDINFNEYWKNKDSIHYYVHGKDNIPFHTIIFPSLLKAHGGYKLPDRIISNEYLTLEGEKISTSKNWAIWVPYIINKYNPDSIRYFLTINGPEKRDTDFSWREFVNSNNSELLGAYGNFINRTIVFIKKYYENKIPESFVDNEIKSNTEKLYKDVGILIERGNTKESLEKIFKFVRNANKYFDTQKPWIDIEKDKIKCNNTIYNCIQIIGNLSNLLEPFIPFSSTKVKKSLGIKNAGWRYLDIKNNVKIKDLDILFNRIDKKTINEEINYLKKYF